MKLLKASLILTDIKQAFQIVQWFRKHSQDKIKNILSDGEDYKFPYWMS